MPRDSRQVAKRDPRLCCRPVPSAPNLVFPTGNPAGSHSPRPCRQSSREVYAGRARGPGGLRGGRASRGRGCFGAWPGEEDQIGRGLGGGTERQPGGRRGGGNEAVTRVGSREAGRAEAGPKRSGGRRTLEPRGLGEGRARLFFVSNSHSYTPTKNKA